MHILCACYNRFWLWTDISASFENNNEIQSNKMEVHNSHMIVTWVIWTNGSLADFLRTNRCLADVLQVYSCGVRAYFACMH